MSASVAMSRVAQDISVLLVRELKGVQRELESFPDDPSVWRTVPGISNSAGNLALHVSGNLRHFVGAILGETHYVRDRQGEFAYCSATRSELASEVQTAINVVLEVVPNLSEELLNRAYPEPVGESSIGTRLFLLHLCTHAAYHLGQMGYLRRIVTGDHRANDALSPLALA